MKRYQIQYVNRNWINGDFLANMQPFKNATIYATDKTEARKRAIENGIAKYDIIAIVEY